VSKMTCDPILSLPIDYDKGMLISFLDGCAEHSKKASRGGPVLSPLHFRTAHLLVDSLKITHLLASATHSVGALYLIEASRLSSF
jgi:hypothetical protein